MTKKNSKHSYFFDTHYINCESHLNGFTEEIYKEFDKKAKDLKLEQKINDLFEGKKVNKSEKRAATHVQLRDEIVTTGRKGPKKKFSEWCNTSEKIIVLGIGGSYWGNRLLTTLMRDNLQHNIQIARNVNELKDMLDRDRVTRYVSGGARVLTGSAPHPVKIHFYVLSKSFTTAETLQCLKLAKQLSNGSFEFTAITANKKEAKKHGIKNIISIDESIGGRYSIWSKMSIPSFLNCTDPNYQFKDKDLPVDQEDFSVSISRMHTWSYIDFVRGGKEADRLLLDSPHQEYFEFVKRLAFSDIWFHNHANRNTRAIFSYDHDLWPLSHYFQQLEMESLGKPANSSSEFKKTGQVILSGFGQDAQHAYLQLFHQGTHNLCADIIAPPRRDYADVDIPKDSLYLDYISTLENFSDEDPDISERLLKKDNRPSLIYAQALTQHELLSKGAKKLKKIEKIKGDTPTNIFSFGKGGINDRLENLGFLIATWEHRVFITSVMLQINPFDQFGVNAGKIYTNKYLAEYD